MLISTQNLEKKYQVGSETVVALKGINLSVKKGEFLSIMGPSGSGKELIARKIHKNSKIIQKYTKNIRFQNTMLKVR